MNGWLPALSAIAAWIALFLSLKNNRTAHKALSLALEQEMRNKPSLIINTIDSYIHSSTQSTPRIYVFRIRVANTSDSGNALQELKFVIEHSKAIGIMSNVGVQHDPSLLEHLQINEIDPFKLPCSIAPRTVQEGLALFSFSEDLIKDSKIESYTICVMDTFNNASKREVILLKEISNDPME